MTAAPTLPTPRHRHPRAQDGALRWPLLALGGLLLLGLWAGVFSLLDREHDELLAAEARRNENLALAHEQQLSASLRLIDVRLNRMRREFQRDAASLDMPPLDGGRDALSRFLVSAAVLDEHGDVQRYWPAVTQRANYADRPFFQFQRAAADDALHVDAPLLGRISGRWLVTLSRRLVRPDGQFAGLVLISVDPAYFARLYEATRLGAGGSLAMIGLDGITRVRRNGEQVSFGQNVRQSQLFTALQTQAAGHYMAPAVSDGLQRMVGYRRMDDYPMVAVVASGVDEVLAPWRARRGLYLGAAAVLTLLACGMALLADRQMRNDRRLIARIGASEARYRLIFERNLAGVIRMRPDGVILETNPALQAMFQAEGVALHARAAWALVDPADGWRLQQLRGRLQREGHATGELRAVRGDGQVFDVDVAGAAYVDEAGEPGVLLVLRDITEHQRLLREQRQLHEILDASPDFIGMSTLSGQVLFLNTAAKRMLAPPGAEMPANIEACHPAWAWRLIHETAIPAAMAQGSWTGETAVRLGDGGTVPVLQTVVCHRDGQGRPVHLSTVAKDITPLREAERARQATVVAEQANRAKSEFMSRMSHELRTPLNAILGFSEMLRSGATGPVNDGQRRQLQHVVDAGQHLLALIDDLLDLSRLETGTMRMDARSVDVAALARASVAECAALSAERGAAVRLQGDGSPAWARGDPTRVRQVLMNLLSNAIKYGRVGGQVTVRIDAGPAEVCLRVLDEGEGLRPEQLARLFQPFERLGRERSGVPGTGIGLLISRGLAELMGGGLEARSVLGQGSEFVLRLSAATSADGDAPDPDEAQGPVLPACRVLYVDDAEVNRQLMAELMRQQPAVRLELAGSAVLALELARLQRPDLVLTDLRMPDIDGHGLRQALAADPVLGRVPCIAVSAHAMPEEIAAALGSGFAAYVTKPVQARALFETMARHLPAGRGDSGAGVGR